GAGMEWNAGVATQRTIPIGAEVQDRGVHFRVWAPHARTVAVRFGTTTNLSAATSESLHSEGNEYWSALVLQAADRMRYFLVIDGENIPDPASRFQPDGPHGASQIIDPAFAWTDTDFGGVDSRGQVIYEMHVGTFSAEGTWLGACAHLPHLAQL